LTQNNLNSAFAVDVAAPAGVSARRCELVTGPLLLSPRRFGDERGFFCESFKAEWFAAFGIEAHFIQDNHSLSRDVGVVRGLHFQAPPFAQGKLLRVLNGAIVDIIVDIRAGSPTYGTALTVRLDSQKGDQLWVPIGFAHGFATLEPNTEVLYKVTAPYAPDCEGGLLWDDPALGLDWPVGREKAILSQRDKEWPSLADLKTPFGYGDEARA
jgi:dTDP-4-dehydrorhamnose 3,5-epimerase